MIAEPKLICSYLESLWFLMTNSLLDSCWPDLFFKISPQFQQCSCFPAVYENVTVFQLEFLKHFSCPSWTHLLLLSLFKQLLNYPAVFNSPHIFNPALQILQHYSFSAWQQMLQVLMKTVLSHLMFNM